MSNEYVDLFGRNNFFLEMQDHGLEQDKLLLPQVRRLSTETDIPLVVSNDAHYLSHDDVRAHEILLCIQTGKTMSDPNRMRFSTPDFYVKTRAEMMTLFGEVEHALDRTWDIAQRCQVKLEKVKDPFPDFGCSRRAFGRLLLCLGRARRFREAAAHGSKLFATRAASSTTFLNTSSAFIARSR